MKFIDPVGLPPPLFDALTKSDYSCAPGHLSVSTLNSSPRQRWLKHHFDDRIVIPAHRQLRAFIGTAVHRSIERHDAVNHIAEARITMPVLDAIVSGQPDLYSAPDERIDDYKTVAVASLAYGVKTEFEIAANFYKLLMEHVGFPVKALRIIVIMLDHKETDVTRVRDYPQYPILMLDLPVWQRPYAMQRLEERVRIHQDAERAWRASGFDQSSLPQCSESERWKRPDSWIVAKPGAGRALKVFRGPAAETEAREFGAARAGYAVEKRTGESIRCARSYCAAAPFCSQYAEISKEEAKEDEE